MLDEYKTFYSSMVGVGEMAQQLRSTLLSYENKSSDSSINVRQLTNTCNSNSKGSNSFLWLQGTHAPTHLHKYIYTCICTQILNEIGLLKSWTQGLDALPLSYIPGPVFRIYVFFLGSDSEKWA